jgi:hypothetical protein
MVPDPFLARFPTTDRVTLSTGETVPLPLKFWSTQALRLWGVGDLEATNGLLSLHGVAAVPFDGKASIGLVALDYQGMTLGPTKAFHSAVIVRDAEAAALFFWHYYSSNRTNNAFKAEVWGISASFGVVETSFLGTSRGARAKADGVVIGAMLWRPPAPLDPCAVAQEASGVVLTGKDIRPTRFRFEARGRVAGRPDQFPFERDRDTLELDLASAMGRDLAAVGFLPLSWELVGDSSGVTLVQKPTASR